MPIIGEINLLRHLARLLPQALKYECSENVLDIDIILDICYSLTRSKTKTERTRLIQTLSKSLGKADWFCGSTGITVADVAVYSTLKQIGDAECNQTLTKWLQKCETLES